jgi:hypothetical protein
VCGRVSDRHVEGREVWHCEGDTQAQLDKGRPSLSQRCLATT